MNTERIFALDIGTRSIVGLILSYKEDHYTVEKIIQKDHKSRAMLDGQIHHVPAVAELIIEIKEEFEQCYGSLTTVSVAAAGRALITSQARFDLPLSKNQNLSQQDILHMELQAVQLAQEKAAQDENSHHYHCVGYSVLHYMIDGQNIGSLEDQKGDTASVAIIATFLPRIVIESLIASLKRAGLSMGALTLEPIAAINVLIPASMRKLNIALVDIGAGTSDIAITNDGTVVAYGMVPIAGDEITECLSEHFILDFPLAEETKRKIQTSNTLVISDILGFENEVSRDEMVEALRPSAEKLAVAISEEIMRLNNQNSPKAVMLVGGGSLTPLLPELLSRKLNLPSSRVAVRGIEAVQGLTFRDSITEGPEFITPVGIAIAAKKSPIKYVTVTLNGHEVRLFEVKQLLISDALLAGGIKFSNMQGTPAPAKMIMLNSQKLTIPGGEGQPPVIQLNGLPAQINDPIRPGDDIIIQQGEQGQPFTTRIRDILEEESLDIEVEINRSSYVVKKEIRVNGVVQSPDYELEDRDSVKFNKNLSYFEVIRQAGIDIQKNESKPFRLILDGKRTFFPQWDARVKVNHLPLRPEFLSGEVKQNDVIEVKGHSKPTAALLLTELALPAHHKIEVSFNGDLIVLNQPSAIIFRNNEPLKGEDSLIYDEELIIHKSSAREFVFQDVFRYSDWQPPTGTTGKVVIQKNGVHASLDEPIKTGDVLELYVK
ncbi:pilus assembly protein PilM [Jeotgalibacillus sp. ET6]|uniref:pilus assembly protein PilM n=1 Tax=Jeotgalibacillus sp. ET6 TaxID=3037260 RepID=UPI0024182083|nr:pilus assembly protein PilM [Jeotgalibacillus sp. ET6]MDG5473472.1 pilus assembly protein PilM [Jeotgalibacillus sp. ET6]